jgi:heme exporter protein C
MPASIALSFLWAPPAETLGETSRMLYFHVPLAFVSALAFLSSGIAAIIYLADKGKKHPLMEHKFHNSARIGMVCTVLTTISGSVWAKMMWGSYWNWDPRETSIAVLLLIYSAYFSLRIALEDNPGRGRISAAYLVFAMATMPFFVFVVPRVYPSLHPDPIINPALKMRLEDEMRITLLVSMASFALLYFYIFSIENRISRIRSFLEESRNGQ